MPKATIDPALHVDVLVDVFDHIRGTIDEALGTNPHRVAIVTRTWSGARVGEGVPTTTVLDLTPSPRVSDDATFAARYHGREERGRTRLTGISLRYTEAELVPSPGPSSEVAYRITERHGQGQRTRYLVPAGPPQVRRSHTDWTIDLEAAADFTPDDAP